MNNQNSITDTEKNIEILSNIKEDLKNNISHITSYHDKSEHMDLISQAVSTNPKIDYIFDIKTDKSLIKDFDSVEYQIINNLKLFPENHKKLVLDMIISIQRNL